MHTHIRVASLCLSSLEQLMVSIRLGEAGMQQLPTIEAVKASTDQSSQCVLHCCCQRAFFPFIYFFITSCKQRDYSFTHSINGSFFSAEAQMPSTRTQTDTQDVRSKVCPGFLLH